MVTHIEIIKVLIMTYLMYATLKEHLNDIPDLLVNYGKTVLNTAIVMQINLIIMMCFAFRLFIAKRFSHSVS